MSIPITKIEATRVARFLSATLSLVDGSQQPHGAWLHVLAKSYGYRNWNAMQPALDAAPDLRKLQENPAFPAFGFRGFAFAAVDAPGRERSFHTVSVDTANVSLQTLAGALAVKVARSADCRGMKFRYTRPDPSSSLPIDDLQSAATTPVVATSRESGVQILLWWISVSFHKSYGDPAAVVVNPPRFQSRGWDAGTPTEGFLERLTGAAMAPRQCLYVPLEASSPFLMRDQGYYPVLVTEGRVDGDEAERHWGLDRMLAVRRAYLENRQAGFSRLDIADIADAHRRNEWDPNEDSEPEIYWMSED